MTRLQPWGSALAVAGLLLCVPVYRVAAQQANGAVGGTVREVDGAPLRGIELVLEGTGRTVLTSGDGLFMLTRVRPGQYTITAHSVGYATASRQIEVVANRVTRLEITLSVQAVELSAINVVGVRRYGANTSESALKFDANALDVPQSVVVISEDFLQDQDATQLDEVLRNVGGISPFSEYQDFTARGFREGEDEVTWNGVKSNAYNFFATPSMYNVERVEVLKGPASVLYGRAEGGALINVVTKSPRAVPLHSFSLTGGSYSRYGGTADLTGPLGGDRLLYRLIVNYENAQSFRRFQKNTDLNIAPSLTWLPAEQTSVTLKGEILRDDRHGQRNRGIGAPLGDLNALPVSWTSNEPTDVSGNDGYTTELNVEQGLGGDWKATGHIRYSYSDYINRYHESRGFTCSLDPTSGSAALVQTCVERGGRIMMRRQYRNQEFVWKTLGWTADVNGTLKTGPIEHRVLVNGDLQKKKKLTSPNDYADPASPLDIYDPVYNVDPADYVGLPPADNPFGHNYGDWGISGQDLITLIPQVKVVGGVRYNHYYVENFNLRLNTRDEHTRTAYTYRGGLVFEPVPAASFYGNYSEGFKPQNNANEDRGGPFDPLITHNTEGGVKLALFNDRLIATTSVYRITKRNVLVPDPDPESNLLVTLGEVRSQGWEIDVVGSIRRNWSVTANYANNDTKITEDPRPAQVGTRFPNAPKNAAAVWTRYDITNVGLGLAGGLSFVDKRLTFDDTVLPSYTTFDGAVYYDLGRYKLSLNVKNLFDKRFFTGGYNNYQLWPGSPRSAQLTVRTTF